MDKIRKQIDEIDKELMDLINQRYALTKLVGEYKRDNHLNINHPGREEEILNKANGLLYGEEIKKIYRQIFSSNKKYQDFKYGLIGNKLPYTISPIIYEKLGIKNYGVIETINFKKTMDKIVYSGVNVTIPYKSEAFDYCDELDESAKVTKTVNTIVRKKGYNTDYLGYLSIFKKLGIDFKNTKVLIIGNGATSRTVAKAVNTKTVFLVRTIRSKNDYYLSDYNNFNDYDYIFNTTPYGTYPNNEDKPIFPLNDFKNLKMVFDVVYNPLKTALILEAKRLGIKYMNGLNLLVEQANISYNLFVNESLDNSDVIISEINKKLTNIVLIGLSYSGKSTLGVKLAQYLNKDFVDIDNELKKDGHDLNSLINDQPVSVFREYEAQVAKAIGNKFNQVISTGGGTVLSSEAMNALSRNSIIIFLDVSLELLKTRIDGSRPLIKTKEDLDTMYQDRINLYRQYADIIISENTSIDQLLEKINENINN